MPASSPLVSLFINRCIPACLLLVVVVFSDHVQAAGVQIVSDGKLSAAAQHGVDELSAALKARGHKLPPAEAKAGEVQHKIVLGNSGSSRQVDQLIEQHKLELKETAESLLIKHLPGENPPVLLLAGRDERGLTYALLEAAAAIRHAPPDTNPHTAVTEAAETPLLKVRSVSIHLMNADLDRPWYFSEEHWHAYFAMLARCRFNNFILTFADQTNYMAPPFPWLFASPEFPAVTVEGLSKADQARNYQMLRRISEMAQEHGVDFTLGIWQQQPVLTAGVPSSPTRHNYGPTDLRNLPAGKELMEYNTQSLGRLLRECPLISGLQLRLNDESGIEEDAQQAYFEKLFAAVKNCGHPMRLELRYKGLRPATIDQANAAGLDVTVTTKFWCEHLGLPFHPTRQDPLYSASRYGYGTLLKRPRSYRVGYQLWNQGSSRLLLWGDPTYGARFAESCVQGDGEACEISAPLTDRGWGNEPGEWNIFADRSLEQGNWPFERYWLYYLSFGRTSYNPHTAAEVWQRELRTRFGPAAAALETAYRQASQVLPLLTVTQQFSASEWSYWPEMEAGHSLEEQIVVQPSDYGQFYSIGNWKRVKSWRTDNWTGGPGFVEDALADQVTARWSPVQVCRKLDQLADSTLAALAESRAKASDTTSSEFRATELDLSVLANLARFHAAKQRAALHLAFFHATGEAGRLTAALKQTQQATATWREIVKLTEGKYHDRLIFGRTTYLIGPAEKKVDSHAGHWKDWLPEVERDERTISELLAKQEKPATAFRVYPGEVLSESLPQIEHAPVLQAASNESIKLIARVSNAAPLRGVFAYYRPMDQTQAWKQIALQPSADGIYQAVISSKEFNADFNLQYYLEARIAGGGTLYPNWEEQTPYFVVQVRKE